MTAGLTGSRMVTQRWPWHHACAQLRKQPWQRQHYVWSCSVNHEVKSKEDPSRSWWPLTGRFKVLRVTYNWKTGNKINQEVQSWILVV